MHGREYVVRMVAEYPCRAQSSRGGSSTCCAPTKEDSRAAGTEEMENTAADKDFLITAIKISVREK
jgi:hypothetical protein